MVFSRVIKTQVDEWSFIDVCASNRYTNALQRHLNKLKYNHFHAAFNDSCILVYFLFKHHRKEMGEKGMGEKGMREKGMGEKGMGEKGMGEKGMGERKEWKRKEFFFSFSRHHVFCWIQAFDKRV